MADLLLSTEWLVAACAVLVALVVSATFVRRRTIARGEPLVVCAIREAGSPRWRFGLARYGPSRLDWFTLGGLSTRPARRWERAGLDIDVPRRLTGGLAVLPEAVAVACSHGGVMFELALGPGSYTALRSWLEASPPGYNANVA